MKRELLIKLQSGIILENNEPLHSSFETCYQQGRNEVNKSSYPRVSTKLGSMKKIDGNNLSKIEPEHSWNENNDFQVNSTKVEEDATSNVSAWKQGIGQVGPLSRPLRYVHRSISFAELWKCESKWTRTAARRNMDTQYFSNNVEKQSFRKSSLKIARYIFKLAKKYKMFWTT